jgi:hypothetical protein
MAFGAEYEAARAEVIGPGHAPFFRWDRLEGRGVVDNSIVVMVNVSRSENLSFKCEPRLHGTHSERGRSPLPSGHSLRSGVRKLPIVARILPLHRMDSLEARSRDVQERTFCKWSPIVAFPSPPALTSPRQVEHEARIARVSADDLPGQGSVRWRAAYSADGEVRFHLLGIFSHTLQEIMGTFYLFLAQSGYRTLNPY